MTKFEGTYLTDAGISLCQNKALKNIVFTRAVTGSGKYLSKNEVKELTKLKEQQQAFELNSFSKTSTDTIMIQFAISNKDLERSYKLTEVGIYALDDSNNEVLYCVAFSYEDNAETVPAENGSYEYMVKINIETAISNDVEVIMVKSEHPVEDEFKSDSEFPLKNKVITRGLMDILDESHINSAYTEVFGG